MHVLSSTFKACSLKNNLDLYLKWLGYKGGFLKCSKSTSEKCLEIIIFNFDKYLHGSHPFFKGFSKYTLINKKMLTISDFLKHRPAVFTILDPTLCIKRKIIFKNLFTTMMLKK